MASPSIDYLKGTSPALNYLGVAPQPTAGASVGAGYQFTPEQIAANRQKADQAQQVDESTSALGAGASAFGLGVLDVAASPLALGGALTEGLGELTESTGLKQAGRALGEASNTKDWVAETASLFGGQDAEDSVRQAFADQERAFPTLTTVARIGGSIVGGFGVAGLASKAGGGAAALLASRASAVAGGAAGGAQGAYEAGAPYADVITSTALGAALGFTLHYAGSKLQRVKAPQFADVGPVPGASIGAKTTDALLEGVPDPVKSQVKRSWLGSLLDDAKTKDVTPDNWDKLPLSTSDQVAYQEQILDAASVNISDVGNRINSASDRLREAFGNLENKKPIVAANMVEIESSPQLNAAALQRSAAWLDQTESELYDTLGPRVLRPKELGDLRGRVEKLIGAYDEASAAPIVRRGSEVEATGDAGKQAARALRREIGNITDVEDLEDTIVRLDSKSGPAFRAASKELQSFAESYGEKLGERSRFASQGIDWRSVRGYVTEIERNFKVARAELESAEVASDAYVSLDRFRRNIKPIADKLTRAAAAHESSSIAAGPLRDFSQNAYTGLAEGFLRDAHTWGAKQAAAQTVFNTDWKDAIQSGKFGLNKFTTGISTDLWNRTQYTLDPEKLRGHLKGIRSKAVSGERLQDWFGAQAKLLKSLREQYPGSPQGLLDDALAAETEALGAAAKFERAQTFAAAEPDLRSQILSTVMNKGSDALSAGIGGMIAGPIGSITSILIKQAIGKTISSPQGASKFVGATAQGAKAILSGASKGARGLGHALSSGTVGYVSARELFANRMEQIDEHMRTFDDRTVLSLQDSLPKMVADGIVPDFQAKLMQLKADVAHPDPNILGLPEYANLSEQEADVNNAKIEATLDPISVIRDFAAGTMNPEKIKYAWKQYPGMQMMLIAGMQDVFHHQLTPEQALSIPHSTMTQLDDLLGGTGALQPMQNLANLNTFASMQPPPAAQPGQSPQGAPLKTPMSELTHTQKIASGG